MSGRGDVTRRGLLVAAGGVAVAGMPDVASAGEGGHVGAARRDISFEFLAKLTQDGADFSGFGYLTRVAGLPAWALFSPAAVQSEAAAHFTFFTRAKLTGRSFLETLKALDADGEMTFYYRAKPGADFSDPASFAKGVRIAGFAGHYQSVVTAQSATAGSQELRGLLVQQSAPGFRAGERRLRFGAKGVRQRIVANGWSELLSATGPRAEAYVAGLAELA